MLLYVFIFSCLHLNYIKTNSAKVVKVNTKSYLLNSGSYQILLQTDEKIGLDDIVLFEKDELIRPNFMIDDYQYTLSNYYRSNNIQFILKTNQFKVIKQDSIRSIVYRFIDSLKHSNFYKQFLYQIQGIETDGQLLYLGFQYHSLFLLLEMIFNKSKYKRYIAILFLFMIYFLNPLFSILRVILFQLTKIILKERKNSLGIACIACLILFPHKVYSLSLIIPYFLNLVSIFKSRYIDRKTLLVAFSSYFFFEINLLKLCLFRYLQTLQAVIFLSAILLMPFPNVFVPIAKLYLQILSILEVKELIIYGKINLFAIALYVSIVYFLNHFTLIKNYIILILVLKLSLFNIFTEQLYINVRHGDSILLRSNFNRDVILIDTGDYHAFNKVKSVLKSFGIQTIDYLIITHNDQDHRANIDSLQETFNIKKIIRTHQDVISKDFKLYSLNHDHNNTNDSSLVFLSEINHLRFLYTGDISARVENDILKKYDQLRIDVLKVAHHGSETSTSQNFISKTNPFLAIISCSNKYNFPHHETINTLENNNVHYFTTKVNGDIKIIHTNLANFYLTSRHEFGIIIP